MHPQGALTSVHFHFAQGFLRPNTRIDVRLLGPCFKTGHLRSLCQHPSRSAVLNPSWQHRPWAITLPEESHIPKDLIPPRELMLARTLSSAPPKMKVDEQSPRTALKCFPFNNFTCCLTLLPECFSPFDHSTCALSVSCQYLALDGIYHPIRAAFPNNSTLRRPFT